MHDKMITTLKNGYKVSIERAIALEKYYVMVENHEEPINLDLKQGSFYCDDCFFETKEDAEILLNKYVDFKNKQWELKNAK